MSELVTIGESMARLSSSQVGLLRHANTLAVGVAGAESNVAVGFHRLGGSATWIGRVGEDELGSLVAAAIRGTGVRTELVVDPNRPTGLMIKERRSGSLSRVTYYREDSAGSRLGPDDIPEEALAEARVVHLTGITTAIGERARAAVFHTVASARSHDTLVSFDINYRSALWTEDEAGPVLRQIIGQTDVLFCTFEEAQLIVRAEAPEEAAESLAAMGPREVVVKLGSQGCVAWVDGSLHREPAVNVPLVDPVGAGDAFAAGYLFELVRGAPVEQRLATGNLTGAFAVSVDGDWEGAPSYADLQILGESGDAVHR